MTFIQEDGWDCHKNNFIGFNDLFFLHSKATINQILGSQTDNLNKTHLTNCEKTK